MLARNFGLCRRLAAVSRATWLDFTDEKELPLKWGGEEMVNVRWQVPLRGQGHASSIVSGDAVFVCTVEWPANSSPREKSMPAHQVARYRTIAGKLMWDTLVPPGPWLRTDFRSGPGVGYAAPTPVTDGQQVDCLFGWAHSPALRALVSRPPSRSEFSAKFSPLSPAGARPGDNYVSKHRRLMPAPVLSLIR